MPIPPSQYDLTTLADCQNYAGITNGADKDAFQQLVTSVSRQIIRYIGFNPCIATNYEIRDGNNGSTIVVQNPPVASIQSVSIRVQSGIYSMGAYPQPIAIPASDGSFSGYMFNANRITLLGYRFTSGLNNIVLSYTSGNVEGTNESQIISLTTGQVIVVNFQTFFLDFGVKYLVNGALTAALQAVTGAPGPGQYTVSQGIYTFNAADKGKAVVLSYQYAAIPQDIAEACIELVAQQYNRRKHIDQVSVVAGTTGQKVQYSSEPMPKSTRIKLDQIRSRLKPL